MSAIFLSDMTTLKKRPSLCLGQLEGHGDNDYIICAITSQSYGSYYSIELNNGDFAEGSINHDSFIQSAHLITAHSSLLLYKAGTLRPEKLSQVIEKIKLFFDS